MQNLDLELFNISTEKCKPFGQVLSMFTRKINNNKTKLVTMLDKISKPYFFKSSKSRMEKPDMLP